MTDGTLHIGVVGVGTFVEIAHFPTYFNSPYREFVHVAALCDLNEKRLKSVGEKYGVSKLYTDHLQMLKEVALDAVVVVTPDHAHTQIVLDAVNAGCDVLVEKPLTMKTAEAQQILQAAAQAHALVLVDFHKREDPCHQEARQRILSGEYGPLQFGWAWMQDAICVPAGDFFKSDLARKSSPNWFLGVHFYDLVRFLTDLKVEEVRATGWRQVLSARGIDTYDAVKADFSFENGAAVSVFSSWNLPNAAPVLTRQGIYLQFAEGDVEIDSSRRGFAVTGPREHRFVNPMFLRRTPRGRAGYGIESIGEALRLLWEARKGKRKELIQKAEKGDLAGAATAWDGLQATLMAEGVDRSLAAGTLQKGVVRGRVVQLSEVPGA